MLELPAAFFRRLHLTEDPLTYTYRLIIFLSGHDVIACNDWADEELDKVAARYCNLACD